MTDREKELGIYIAECVNGLPDSGDNGADCMTLAQALIQRYPQILAEKVWEGNQSDFLVGMWDQQIKFKGKNVQVFIREVKE